MTRCFAAAAIAVFLVFFSSNPIRAQANKDSDLQCFPWQEMRNGRCVAKPVATPPPPAPAAAPAPAPPPPPQLSTDPCLRNLSSQCKCAASTHLDATSGTCVADAPVAPVAPPVAPATPKPVVAIVCTGGTVTDGACICPSGFNLMSIDGSPANGGTCVKAHADNCLGGELTVSGICLCTGQVVMSGETYGLEYVNGKCVPKRCPEQTVLKSGKCLAISTTAAAPEPETTTPPVQPRRAEDEDAHRHRCGHGMVITHSGCAPARRRYPVGIGAIPPDLQRYYRNHQTPGFSSATPRN
ncbi:hypothetical protein [Bradyrhizobium sp. Tv2a-2]|uniref:hypothetical protein n=1 Tax=Bradyrhizobium sp. Tv2a-2 TaxID=113395 RepID=UPI00041D6D5A|nr:hypothetical protein [Bradyrhizobium sp. Tv2a-2]